MICSEGDTKISDQDFKTIRIPETMDCLQGILSVIPMQLMSYHLAIMRGHNVSNPRLELWLFLGVCF